MSSTYRPICLNHNPALTIDREIRREALDTFNSRDGLDDHQHCDIVIGRWSGGLCELACPGRQLPGPTGCEGHHRSIEWTDRDWLRLLLAAAPSVDADLLRPLVTGCWPLDRLNRLRLELGVEPQPECLLDQTCTTFSEHGWGRCVEPRDHVPGKHMYRNPAAKTED